MEDEYLQGCKNRFLKGYFGCNFFAGIILGSIPLILLVLIVPAEKRTTQQYIFVFAFLASATIGGAFGFLFRDLVARFWTSIFTYLIAFIASIVGFIYSINHSPFFGHYSSGNGLKEQLLLIVSGIGMLIFGLIISIYLIIKILGWLIKPDKY